MTAAPSARSRPSGARASSASPAPYDDEALHLRLVGSAGLRRRVAALRRLLPALGLPGARGALDLGCGGGTYVRLLAGLGHRAVGLDYSVPSLERALGRRSRRARAATSRARRTPCPFAAGRVRPRRLHRGASGAGRARARPRRDGARPAPGRGAGGRGAERPAALTGLAEEAARRAAPARPHGCASYAPREVRALARGAGPPGRGQRAGSACPRAGSVAGRRRWTRARWRGRWPDAPWVAALAAHSFLFVARKGAGRQRGRAREDAPRPRPLAAGDERLQHAQPQHRRLPEGGGARDRWC